MLPYDEEDRGCFRNSDPSPVGCASSPAPVGSSFEDDIYDATLTFERGEVSASPSSDPVNDTTYTATVVLAIANDGSSPIDLPGEWRVYVGYPGDTLDTCPIDPRSGTIPPGKSAKVTTTCSVDLVGGGKVNASIWTAEIAEGGGGAHLAMQAA